MELSETCRVSCQNKFVKLVHLVGFIINKFVTMQHGHTNAKKKNVELVKEEDCDEKNDEEEKKSGTVSDIVMFGK